MAFDPNASASYKLYQTNRAKFSAGEQEEFDDFVIKAFCQQADLAAAAVGSTIMASAVSSGKQKKHSF